jgi:hypothetical protein
MNNYKVYFTGLVFGKTKSFEDVVTAPSEREAINFVKRINESMSGLKISFIELV